ncbi:MAG: aldehyde dehydrogenase family protein, partial [Burkholderiales bacterium]
MSLLLDGCWVDGHGGAFASRNPVTQAEVWSGCAASPPQVEVAVAAARRAFPAWRDTPLTERIALLRRFAELLAQNKPALAEQIGLETG